MSVTVRSFAKINLGLCIGALRPDGFHDLRTIYQTIAIHDRLTVRAAVSKSTSIEIACSDKAVPTDASNTCYKAADALLKALKINASVTISIDKQLPVQGGLGAASSNAAATIIGIERALKKSLPAVDRLSIAEETHAHSTGDSTSQ